MQSMDAMQQQEQLLPLKDSPEETRSKLVLEARTWLGTPWKHNQNKKGDGVDCVNFLYQIAIAVDIALPPMPRRYKRNVIDNSISAYLSQSFNLVDFENLQKGDILVFQWGSVGHHVGIVTKTNPICFIHADNRMGFVLEQNLDTTFIQRLIEQYSLCD